MENKNVKRSSKFLSLVLRHKPEVIGIQIDEAGWVDTAELIEKCSQKGRQLDMPTLEAVVRENNKKRFSFNADKTRIRANQGHSIKVNLGYTPIEPPEFLYHGTATRFLDNIREKGLLKRDRHHVHLSAEKATALDVGSRHGKPIILVVKSAEMNQAGYDFFCSENGVWLTEHVPIKYLIG